MDRRERVPTGSLNSTLLAIKAGVRDKQSNIWTALPATVDTFNAAALTVSAQPTVQVPILQPNGTWVDTTISLCLDCPIMYPGGGGFVFTFPLAKGDEGLLVFASRCIDAWWQNGGVQKQAELRMHDLSDGFFIPTGGMSQPNIPTNVSTTSAQMRTKDGSSFVDLNPEAGGTVTIKATNIVLDGNVQMGGNGNTIIGQGGGAVDFGNTRVKQNGKFIDSEHTHGGVQPGAGDTGVVN